MALPSHLHVSTVNVLLGVGLIAVGIHSYRQYSGVSITSFSAFTIVWGGSWSLLYLEDLIKAVLGVPQRTELVALSVPQSLKLALVGIELLGFIAQITAPLLWGVFVLKFTSRLRKLEKAVFAAIFGLVLVLAVGSGARATPLWTPSDLLLSLLQVVTLFAQLAVLGVTAAGIVHLYRVSTRFRPITRPMVASLAGILLFPLLSLLTAGYLVSSPTLTGLYNSGGQLLGLGCCWLAVRHYGVFSQLPAAQAVGRETAIESLDTAIVVLDGDGYVTDLNAAAEQLFDTTATDTIGDSLRDLLPDGVDRTALWEDGRATVQVPGTDRILDAETAVSTDADGQELGRTIVFYDITEERRRQERIQVLNRVLRHNLRNDLSAVENYSDLIADGGVDVAEYNEKITAQINEVIELGEKAREIESLLKQEPTVDPPVQLRPLVDEAVDAVTPDGSNARVTINVPDGVVVSANPAILRPIIREIVENAVEHNGTESPEVNVMMQVDRSAVVVSDNGPGIPSYEVDVLEIGEETALEHGSGIGLWLVKWGVERLGGTISFDTEAGGTQVIVTLPEGTVSAQPA